MTLKTLECDYLVVGAGAMGMAFADELMKQNPGDRLILVDRHAKPGGHWNDAYSFVWLHQPAAFYGVNSEKLGPGGSALASGTEVLAYYERVLAKLLETGRLQHFPMCESRADGAFASLVEADLEYQVTVRKKTVDATYMNVQVPSIRVPQYRVSPEINLVPPNDLPRVRKPRSGYVIIGAGKTGMDAALFLLDQGVDPDHITWIISNDAWLLDRAQIQPGRMADQGLGGQLKHFARCHSLDELFTSLESDAQILRLDSAIWPSKYRCATVSLHELEQLRGITDVVRMGRVQRIDATTIVLDEGSVPTDPGKLHVDCTADGLASRPVRPVFDGDTLTLQSLFMCQQVFSAAVIAYVETRYDDEVRKNQLCEVVPHPEFSRDFVRAIHISMMNIEQWAGAFGKWLRGSRLFAGHHEPLFKLLLEAIRSRKSAPQVRAGMQAILEQEFPEKVLEETDAARG
ncbi:MAG: NAD(P)/FAD-dependent oxidoreductase [Myxococcales bacterium]|nr:NAD(P)/FAD-dependent oxidoreductase [Myxococcales bacterium]